MSKTISKLDERWRPTSFADLVGNQPVISDVRTMVKKKYIPHLLLTGPAGTGKTSLALVIVKELFNGNSKRKFCEINASDDNGIATIRGRVKEFAKMSGSQNGVDFRVIILDEADSMTDKAQTALRRTMEKYHKHCRFVLIGNYKWKFIDPIQSRCTRYDFVAIKPEEMLPRLKFITERENIRIEQDALEYVADKANGDMRAALNDYLERFKFSRNGKITLANVKKLAPTQPYALKILKSSLNNRFLNGTQHFYTAIKDGHNVRQIINQIDRISYSNHKYPEAMIGDISMACLESEKLIIDGCTPNLVVNALCRRLGILGKTHKPSK